MPKLTKGVVEGVELPASGNKVHWDDRMAGYGLRVTSGWVRAYAAQGRVHGRAVIATIGRHGLFTEDQARRKAQAILQGMLGGVDPNAEKRAAAEAQKVEELRGKTLREVADAYFADKPLRAAPGVTWTATAKRRLQTGRIAPSRRLPRTNATFGLSNS